MPASLLSVLGMVLAVLAITGQATPAHAAQAPGHDVPVLANGWSWTYDTTFSYNDGAGTNATLEERVTYTNAGRVTFRGQDAYKFNISGSINGGGGSTNVDSLGRVTLTNFSGSVTGTRYLRASDLALLQESQDQHLNGDAKYSIFTIDVSADIDLTLTPTPGWRTHDFPLNGGDSYRSEASVNYSGGFNYTSSAASGNGPFDGTLDFDAPATVSSGSVSVPIGNNVSSDVISATSTDGTVDNHWWSPAHKADARHFMRIPMDDGAVATIDRKLRSASIPAPSGSMTETITPSLTCAGGPVTVSGKVGNSAGVPVTIALDKSPVSPGQKVTTTTTTTANGNYSATITAPSENDGMGKNGSRANWGVLVSGGGASSVATLVVTHQNCSEIDYTGASAAPQGTDATVSARLTDLGGANPAGRTVKFTLSGGASTTATTNSAGVATATLPVAGPPRAATITAEYAGSPALAAARKTVAFEVGKISTSTSVTPSEAEATLGDPVTFTAAVVADHGGPATGDVQFVVDGSNFGAAVSLSGGSASSAPLGNLDLGEHVVTAVFAGSSDFAGSTSPEVTFTVRTPRTPTTTTSAVTPAASVYGQPVTLSASVDAGAGSPTGSVSFRENGIEIASAPLDGAGEASTTISTLDVGSHSIVARYSGDDDHNVSSAGPRTVTVSRAAVVVGVSSSDADTVTGEAVSFTAQVAPVAPGAGAPNGAVQLVIDGNDVGAPVWLDAGSAAFPAVTSLGAGSHTVEVRYAGSGRYQAGSDTLQQQVAKAGTTTSVVASPSPSNQGQNVTFTANVIADAPGSGTPTGTVTFTSDGELVGAATLEFGVATVSIADLAPGSYDVVASYSGSGDYMVSESEGLSHTVVEAAPVVATTTTLGSSANPAAFGSLITFRADVDAADDSAPVGAVQFSVDGIDIGGPVAVDGDGVAVSPSLGAPEPGDHAVIATFVPASGYSGGGAIITQTVETAGVDLTVESSAPIAIVGDAVTLTATVTSQVPNTEAPTGPVQFMVDGHPVGTAVRLEDGRATSPTVPDLGPGVYEVSVVYGGSLLFSAATTTYSQVVKRVATTTELSVSAPTSSYQQDVALTAVVTPATGALGTPSGSVQFVEGSTVLATVPVSAGPGDTAVATATVGGLAAGSHDVRAIYSGSYTFDASASRPQTLQVTKAATTMEADPALVQLIPLRLPLAGLRATLTSGTTPVAGVPVTFTVAGKTACTSVTDANGVATCNAFVQLVGLLLTGYTASFPGNDNYQASSAKGWPIK